MRENIAALGEAKRRIERAKNAENEACKRLEEARTELHEARENYDRALRLVVDAA
jgi:hypothetical protein